MTGKRFAFLCLFFLSCNETQEARVDKYDDIRGFFRTEAGRLEKQNKTVSKTVRRNGILEKKNNISPVWDTELSLFSESDINKPAWRDSYRVDTDSTGITYTALDDKLRTRSIRIKKNIKGKLIELAVVNRTRNYLYSSSEELFYKPDSLYRIIKMQDVLLLGKNSYEIIGIF